MHFLQELSSYAKYWVSTLPASALNLCRTLCWCTPDMCTQCMYSVEHWVNVRPSWAFNILYVKHWDGALHKGALYICTSLLGYAPYSLALFTVFRCTIFIKVHTYVKSTGFVHSPHVYDIYMKNIVTLRIGFVHSLQMHFKYLKHHSLMHSLQVHYLCRELCWCTPYMCLI